MVRNAAMTRIPNIRCRNTFLFPRTLTVQPPWESLSIPRATDLIATVAGVYDILFGMRRCRIKLPNRCCRLISRVAHRAMTKDGKRRIERVAPL